MLGLGSSTYSRTSTVRQLFVKNCLKQVVQMYWRSDKSIHLWTTGSLTMPPALPSGPPLTSTKTWEWRPYSDFYGHHSHFIDNEAVVMRFSTHLSLTCLDLVTYLMMMKVVMTLPPIRAWRLSLFINKPDGYQSSGDEILHTFEPKSLHEHDDSEEVGKQNICFFVGWSPQATNWRRCEG